MANTIIQIKRSGVTSAPASLNYGELAYSWNSNTLYIGNSTSGVEIIAGQKYIVPLNGYTAGTWTASKVVVPDTNALMDQLKFGTTTSNAVANSTGLTISATTNNVGVYQSNLVYLGNSTVNTSITSLSMYSGNSSVFFTSNSTADVLVSATGNNVTTATSVVLQTNTTVNASLSATTLSFANAVGNAQISPQLAVFQTNTTVNTNVAAANIFVANNLANTNLAPGVIKLANTTSNVSIVVPSVAQATATNYFLNANGQWATVATGVATPAGANQQVQYNDSGSSNGALGLTFDKSTNNVTVANTLLVGAGGQTTISNTLISVGNSTVNAQLTSTVLTVANSVHSGTVTVGGTTVVNSTIVTVAGAVNSATVAATTSVTVGNSVVNTTSFTTSTNSTVNATLTATTLTIANSLFSATLTPQTLSVRDVAIAGNLTVGGTQTIVQGTTLATTDNLIQVGNATNNTADLGIYGAYGNSTVTNYAGMFFAAADNKFKFFFANTTQPTTTAPTSLGTIAANTIELTNPLAVAYGGTGKNAFTGNAVMYTTNTTNIAFMAFGGDGTVLQMQSTTLAFGGLDGGTF